MTTTQQVPKTPAEAWFDALVAAAEAYRERLNLMTHPRVHINLRNGHDYYLHEVQPLGDWLSLAVSKTSKVTEFVVAEKTIEVGQGRSVDVPMRAAPFQLLVGVNDVIGLKMDPNPNEVTLPKAMVGFYAAVVEEPAGQPSE